MFLVTFLGWRSSRGIFLKYRCDFVHKVFCCGQSVVEGLLWDYVDKEEEQADRDIRLITGCGPAPESVRIQGRNVHRRSQSSEDSCQKAPSRVSKNTKLQFRVFYFVKALHVLWLVRQNIGKTLKHWGKWLSAADNVIRDICPNFLMYLFKTIIRNQSAFLQAIV